MFILPSELRKLEKEGFVIDEPFEVGNYRYIIEANVCNLNKQYFSVRVIDIEKGEGQTILTRGNIGTAISKVKEHIAKSN